MKSMIFFGCMMLTGCVIGKPSDSQAHPTVIRIQLEHYQKVSNINLTPAGLLAIETRRAYQDESAEQIVYTTYQGDTGKIFRRYIVTEHPSAQ